MRRGSLDQGGSRARANPLLAAHASVRFRGKKAAHGESPYGSPYGSPQGSPRLGPQGNPSRRALVLSYIFSKQVQYTF